MAKTQSGKIRIIGGLWKRSTLSVADANGLRPTADRARETLFNWLYTLLGSLDGMRSLDLFAGTGVLSFEFLSRGGASALAFEKNRAAAKLITQTAQKLSANIEVKAQDCFSFSADPEDKFDLVFIDPPFAEKLQEKSLLFVKPLLSEHALVYVESADILGDEALKKLGYEALRRSKIGASHLLLAKPVE